MNLNITQTILLLDIYGDKFQEKRHPKLDEDMKTLRGRGLVVDHKTLTGKGYEVCRKILLATEED